MDAIGLAKLALLVLDKQAEYFKTRDRALLVHCKKLESELRKKCETILAAQQEKDANRPKQDDLFGEIPEFF